MADWTTLADSQLDPDAPLTSELAYAWRDNPIAIAEGAVGAPRVQPEALDLHLARIELTDTTPVTVTGINPSNLVTIYVFAYSSHNTLSNSLRIRFSNDGGATFGGWIVVISSAGGSSGNSSYLGPVNLTTGERYDATTNGAPFQYTTYAPVNAIGFDMTRGDAGSRATAIIYAKGLAQ